MSLNRIEWLLAVAFAAIIIGLRYVNLQHAGGLWRDESNAMRVASLPSLAELWSHLCFDSFPILPFIALRFWSALGLAASDPSLRWFGLLAGVAVLGVLWWNAYNFSKSPPLISMLLFGINPLAIHWGDSIRGYGVGIFFALLTLGLIWNVLTKPSALRVLYAMIAGICAVQCLYQNAVLLFSICAGGATVALIRRETK